MRLRAGQVALILTVLVLAAWASPAQATVSGLFSDDDGIPEERNIEHLAGLGILEGCDVSAVDRFCPAEPVTLTEAVKALIRAKSYLRGQPLPLALDSSVEGLGRFLSRVQIIAAEDPVVEAALERAIMDSLGISLPPGWEADREKPLSRATMAETLARALGEDQCRKDPFTADRLASLTERYPAQTFQAYAYDTRTRCAYWMNPEERMRTASVFKVLVMAGVLLEAQEEGRDLTGSEWDALTPMITESANWPVRSLWRRYGASPWFSRQAEIFGLNETTVVGDDGRSWGGTRTSAKDQAELMRQVLLGEWGPLDPEYREMARELMTSVVESQTWGVTGGVPDGWTVAQKNGFAGRTANSVGYVEGPGREDGYVVAILSHGWAGWRAGVGPIEEISAWVAEALAIEKIGG